MLALPLSAGQEIGTILAIGAHADDLEIGCGGTILALGQSQPDAEVVWVVLSSDGTRAVEARRSADDFLQGFSRARVIVEEFRDGFFPYLGGEVKEFFEGLKSTVSPDIVFTHQRSDLHQDHRLVNELTWNTFRNHLILEYEIPKYDGDLGSPNVFVHLSDSVVQRKRDAVRTHFVTQQDKHWFTDDLFDGLLRLRGMECNSPSGRAEAFYCRKLVVEAGA
jgi:LmbE family N-acetylglucosaminyl deacetylase